MIQSLVVPGVGTVDVEVLPSEFAKPDQAYVQRMSTGFYIIRHRPSTPLSELQLIKVVQGHHSAERADIESEQRLTEQRRLAREGGPTVVGHIGGETS